MSSYLVDFCIAQVFQCEKRKNRADNLDSKIVRKFSLNEERKAKRSASHVAVFNTAFDAQGPTSSTSTPAVRMPKCPKTYMGKYDKVSWWASDCDTTPGDANIRAEELKKLWPKIFSRLDVNGDGLVLANEIEAAASKL